MEKKTQNTMVKTGDENPVNRTSTKIKVLPEDAEGDYNLLLNKLPSPWDLRTDWARSVIEKVKDLVINEAQKVAYEREAN